VSRYGQTRIGAVLLAGGASRRFGADNKLLAPVAGAPLIAKVAREIQAAGIDELVVVTGAEAEAYRAALDGLDRRFVHNSDWEAGLGGSVAVGAAALSPSLEAAFFVPGDMPGLDAALFSRLTEAFLSAQDAPIVVPVTAAGAQRNPVLWPRRHFPKLAALGGDKGGKPLLDTLADERLDVAFDDEARFADIDTADDYARLVEGDET
jgi:molybdenum cofactor cytidylyltransferase